MSLLNICIDARRALVAVDTLTATLADGVDVNAAAGVAGMVECSKILPLVHADLVVAGRGNLLYLSFLFTALHAQPGRGVDEFDEAMDLALQQTMSILLRAGKQSGENITAASLAAQEVALVGWSKAQQRMVGYVYRQFEHGEGFERHVVADSSDGPGEFGDWVAPWFPEQGNYPLPSNPQAMAVIARSQVEQLKKLNPRAPGAGGRLVLATLTKDSMSFQATNLFGGQQ